MGARREYFDVVYPYFLLVGGYGVDVYIARQGGLLSLSEQCLKFSWLVCLLGYRSRYWRCGVGLALSCGVASWKKEILSRPRVGRGQLS
jgi:hypothetical protein